MKALLLTLAIAFTGSLASACNLADGNFGSKNTGALTRTNFIKPVKHATVQSLVSNGSSATK